jgi:hypothetical protein
MEGRPALNMEGRNLYMETDREFLLWLHDRMVHVHKESELFGYMHRLRSIIAATPKERYSWGPSMNSMEALKEQLKTWDSPA